MSLIIAVIWTIIFIGNIILIVEEVPPTWWDVLPIILLVVIDSWVAYYEINNRK